MFVIDALFLVKVQLWAMGRSRWQSNQHLLSSSHFSVLCQALADKKKNVTDEDVLALVSDEVHQPEKLWDLLGLQVRWPRDCGA